MPQGYPLNHQEAMKLSAVSMSANRQFALRSNESIFLFESCSKKSTTVHTIFDKIVLRNLEQAFPAIIFIDKTLFGPGHAVFRLGLVVSAEIMNEVFLAGGYSCTTNKGPCIFVSVTDLSTLQGESSKHKEINNCYLFG